MNQTLWSFSVAVYGNTAVQDECLKLQDQLGLDVNVVLLCAFLGAIHGITLTREDILSARQEVREWQEEIVATLRTTRRNLKAIEMGQDALLTNAARDLRTQVKAAELESEKIEQTILEQWAKIQLAVHKRGNSRDAILANLQVLLTAYDIGPERLVAANCVQHLMAAALHHARQ
jgi:uncharacterized protein (TIGR02444 family)